VGSAGGGREGGGGASHACALCMCPLALCVCACVSCAQASPLVRVLGVDVVSQVAAVGAREGMLSPKDLAASGVPDCFFVPRGTNSPYDRGCLYLGWVYFFVRTVTSGPLKASTTTTRQLQVFVRFRRRG